MGQQARLFQARKDRKIHPIAGTRPQGIEQGASLVVTGHRLNAKHRTGIMVSLGFLQMALVLQQRRRWGAKDAQGAHGGILDAVTGVWPAFALVRQGIDPSVHDALESLEASGGAMAISSVLWG